MNGESPHKFDPYWGDLPKVGSITQASLIIPDDCPTRIQFMYGFPQTKPLTIPHDKSDFRYMQNESQHKLDNSMNEESYVIVSRALNTAMHHAERVCKREHIKADRFERVNQFITSIRRELGGYVTIKDALVNIEELKAALSRKEIWYDIGVLNKSFTGVGQFSKSYIQPIVERAKALNNSIYSAAEQIAGDLEDLESTLSGMSCAIEEAQRINSEGDLVTNSLCRLFE